MSPFDVRRLEAYDQECDCHAENVSERYSSLTTDPQTTLAGVVAGHLPGSAHQHRRGVRLRDPGKASKRGEQENP